MKSLSPGPIITQFVQGQISRGAPTPVEEVLEIECRSEIDRISQYRAGSGYLRSSAAMISMGPVIAVPEHGARETLARAADSTGQPPM